MPSRRRSIEAAFGDGLRSQRHKVSLSQEGLAHLCDMHPTYISQLERGLKSPSLKTIFLLAKALKRSPHQLVKAAEDNLG